MHDEIINEILGDRVFNTGVDLGCGSGTAALRDHCNTIIGVDHNRGRLNVAYNARGYDEVIESDVAGYEVPPGVDAVFALEVIEHLPKQEGYYLVQGLSHVPYIMFTTPNRFIPVALENGHKSLWSEEDFQELGFTTTLHSRSLLYTIVYHRCIVAIIDRQPSPVF